MGFHFASSGRHRWKTKPRENMSAKFWYHYSAVTKWSEVLEGLGIVSPSSLEVEESWMLLIAVLLFTSGHMFNHIRKVPYVAADGKGGVSYFAGGFQNQFGLETQIVAALYGILSFATISLALKVPRMAEARSQQIAVFVWGGVILGTYSFLLSVFRIKNGGYPF